MQRLRIALVAAAIASASPIAIADPVNVNSASAEVIAKNLDGIGITKARAIVAYRNENGPFKTPSELTRVTGIGKRTLAMNADDILVTDAGAEDAPDQ